MVKKLSLPLITSVMLVACGPSEDDIRNVSIITCNVMGESRNMDAAMRIKEINAAREKIGADPYLGTDQGIKEAFEHGLCTQLVSNDPSYAEQLAESKERRLAEERRAAEERRLAAERAREAALAEERRLAEERKLAEYRRRALEMAENWERWEPPRIVGATMLAGGDVQVDLECGEFKSPLIGSFRVVFKDSAGALFLDGRICPKEPLVLTGASASMKNYLSERNVLDAISYSYLMVDGEASMTGKDFRLDLRIGGR